MLILRNKKPNVIVGGFHFSDISNFSQEIPIIKFGKRGEGIGLIDGKEISICGTIPGEVVKCDTVTPSSILNFLALCSYSIGKLQGTASKIIKESEKRVAVECPYFSTCGACQFLHISYSEQLQIKKQFVIDSTKQKFQKTLVQECIPSPIITDSYPFQKRTNEIKNIESFFYRNKISLYAYHCEEDGKTKVGYFHKDDSNKVISIDSCIVCSYEINQFLKNINSLIELSGIIAVPRQRRLRKRYEKELKRIKENTSSINSDNINSSTSINENNGDYLGSLRQMIVRSTNDKKLHIVILSNGQQQKERVIHFNISENLLRLMVEEFSTIIGTVHHTTNLEDPNQLKIIYSSSQSKMDTPWSSGKISENILNSKFYFSPYSFLQVNLRQAENIYSYVIEAMKEMNFVIDAYCGTGILTCLLAKKGIKVIGIDSVQDNINDAILNSRLNHVSDLVKFKCEKTEDYLQSALDQCKGKTYSKQNQPQSIPKTMNTVNVGLIFNPPRTGLNLEVFNNINFSSSQRLPETIAYISCNPTTLFSDIDQIQKLSKFNYNIELINPFDMFPQTNHVETLVILKKMKPKVRQFEEKEREKEKEKEIRS